MTKTSFILTREEVVARRKSRQSVNQTLLDIPSPLQLARCPIKQCPHAENLPLRGRVSTRPAPSSTRPIWVTISLLFERVPISHSSTDHICVAQNQICLAVEKSSATANCVRGLLTQLQTQKFYSSLDAKHLDCQKTFSSGVV